MLELTLCNLIQYVKNKYVYGHFDDSSQLIETIGDGIDIYYMLEDLEKEFYVSFTDFNYTQFFHTESELSTLGTFSLKKHKYRSVKPFNIIDLYKYMSENKKLDKINTE